MTDYSSRRIIGFVLAALLAVMLSACSDDKSADPDQDTRPPGKITDLRVDSTSQGTAYLSWTAPRPLGASSASAYDIRYAADSAILLAWMEAIVASGIPSPKPSGSRQTFEIRGLHPDTVYFFAISSVYGDADTTVLSNIAASDLIPDFVVVFPDEALDAAIRRAIDKPTGDIYYSELVALDTLVASWGGHFGPHRPSLREQSEVS